MILCIWLDGCTQAECSEVSQLTTNSKIEEKVKNVELESKHDNRLLLQK